MYQKLLSLPLPHELLHPCHVFFLSCFSFCPWPMTFHFPSWNSHPSRHSHLLWRFFRLSEALGPPRKVADLATFLRGPRALVSIASRALWERQRERNWFLNGSFFPSSLSSLWIHIHAVFVSSVFSITSGTK